MLRSSLVLAVLSALPSQAFDGVRAGPGALQGDATIDLSVRIPEILRLALLDHPSMLRVSQEDSLRGEVEVIGARILLVANHPRGCSLQARLASGFSEAEIEGLPVAVRVEHGNGLVAMPSMAGRSRPASQPVRYRFRFPRGLPPGDHPWPLSLSLVRL